MNAMCGIEWVVDAPSGLEAGGGRYAPRALPWAELLRPRWGVQPGPFVRSAVCARDGRYAPRALPWAELLRPRWGGKPGAFARSGHRAEGGRYIPGAPPFDVAPSRRRPEGAVTNQPRATPWEHVQQPRPCPERAKQNADFHVRLRRRDSRELWRPYRACASLESRFPGRCPGLSCCGPDGAANPVRLPDRGIALRTVDTYPGHRPLMLRLHVDVPEGQSQISPGQRPGNTSSNHVPALKGRNRMRFFTCDGDVATAENCGALTGHALPWNPGSQGDALGWHVVSPSGRNSE
jgi:hypothetical protein